MAIPVPSTPVTIPDLNTSRGNQKIDLKTKSALTEPVIFTVKNQCDVDSYVKFNASLTVNELTDDCENVQAGTVSIKGQIPVPGNAVDASLLINRVRDAILADLIS